MSKKTTGRIIRSTLDPYSLPPLPTPEQLDKLLALNEIPDGEIDFSDIPDSSCESLRPACKDITLRLKTEVVDWLQTLNNPHFLVSTILREEMLRVRKKAKSTEPIQPSAKSAKKPTASNTSKPRRARRVLEKV